MRSTLIINFLTPQPANKTSLNREGKHHELSIVETH